MHVAMMIEMSKFGTVLNSRPAGREAFLAIRPILHADSELTIDFSGIQVLTPSFADAFITPLSEHMAGQRMRLTHTQENITVQKTLSFLASDWPKTVVIEK